MKQVVHRTPEGVIKSFPHNISLITQQNPMLWVLKRIVSLRRFLLSTHNIGFECQYKDFKTEKIPLIYDNVFTLSHKSAADEFEII